MLDEMRRPTLRSLVAGLGLCAVVATPTSALAFSRDATLHRFDETAHDPRPGEKSPLGDAIRRARELATGRGPRNPRALLLRALPPALRVKVLRRKLSLEDGALAQLEVCQALSTEDQAAAAALVHDMYVRRGITAADPSGLRVTPYTLHPETAVFVAKRAGKVIGTLSIVADSPIGVPMDKIYGSEIATLRERGRRVAEVGALALAAEERGQGIVHLLNKAMLDHARRRLLDDLVISVHPDAEDLYRGTLMFTRMGEVKLYPGLKKSGLAVPLRLDLHTAFSRMQKAYAGRGGFNAYEFYSATDRPEIKVPRAWDLGASRASRAKVAGRLLLLRPETWSEATRAQREEFARVGVLEKAVRRY